MTSDATLLPEPSQHRESAGISEPGSHATPRPAPGPTVLATVGLGAGKEHVAVAMALAKDSLFVLLSDGRVRGLRNQRPLFWIPASPPAVALAVSSDGRSLLTTCANGTNRVFDVSGNSPKLYRRWARKTGSTEGLTHDGAMLVRGDVRRQVRGYALEGYKLQWLVYADGVSMSPDGRWALCRKGETLTLHHGDTGRKEGETLRVSGKLLAMATASRDGIAWVEKTSDTCALRLPQIAPRPLPCHPKTALTYSPCGGLLAISLGNRVQLHHGRSGELLAQHQRTGTSLVAAPLDSQTYVVAGLESDRVTWLRLPSLSPPGRARAPTFRWRLKRFPILQRMSGRGQ